MYAKKFVFTAATMPALVFMNRAADFQQRRAQDKTQEGARRQRSLSEQAVDITPRNGAAFPWAGKDAAQFEQEWSMKPVELRGYLDHSKETFVEKWKDGEKGVEIVTPFYTHLNGKEQPCAVLVNRGWMPWDLKDFRYDKQASVTKVQGILYRGDNQTKYSKQNQPAYQRYHSVRPEEISAMCQLPNEDAKQFMVKAVDFDPAARTVHPVVDSPAELTSFGIPQERHAAYESLWTYLSYAGIVANTAVWLYL